MVIEIIKASWAGELKERPTILAIASGMLYTPRSLILMLELANILSLLN